MLGTESEIWEVKSAARSTQVSVEHIGLRFRKFCRKIRGSMVLNCNMIERGGFMTLCSLGALESCISLKIPTSVKS